MAGVGGGSPWCIGGGDVGRLRFWFWILSTIGGEGTLGGRDNGWREWDMCAW